MELFPIFLVAHDDRWKDSFNEIEKNADRTFIQPACCPDPIRWTAPTRILYGSRDNLTPFETIRDFAKKHHAALTVMEGGEHWFHTEEQMRFLDGWILGK